MFLSDGRFLVRNEGELHQQLVTCNVLGRDIASLVAEPERRVRDASGGEEGGGHADREEGARRRARNGHGASDVARVGRIDRSVERSPCARRCRIDRSVERSPCARRWRREQEGTNARFAAAPRGG
jgi:hypothetical protein